MLVAFTASSLNLSYFIDVKIILNLRDFKFSQTVFMVSLSEKGQLMLEYICSPTRYTKFVND